MSGATCTYITQMGRRLIFHKIPRFWPTLVKVVSQSLITDGLVLEFEPNYIGKRS